MTGARTRLRLLAAIHEALAHRCFYLVSGGYALAAAGHCQEPPEGPEGPDGPDGIELLCFRSDAAALRGELARIGVALAEASPPPGGDRVHALVAPAEHVTVHLLDAAPDNTFEISLGDLPPRRLPLHLIVPRSVTLDRITFPIPRDAFLRLLAAPGAPPPT